MAPPQTPLERAGARASIEAEIEFLAQIAAETSATHAQIGQTVQGNPLWRFDLGQGTENTLLFVGLQHPREPSGREAALALVRDLAYSTDPWVVNYLTHNRIVFIPSLNVDGAFTWRDNANGVNLNRDWFRLSQPETQAAAAVIREVDPTLIYDLHENGAFDWGDWLGTPELISGSYDLLSVLGESLYDSVIEGVVAGGHTAGRYPQSSTPVGSLSAAAGSYHAVGMVHEPSTSPTYYTRVDVSRLAIDAAVRWHADNRKILMDAKAESKAYATTTTAPIPLRSTEMTTGTPFDVDVAGYRLNEPMPGHLIQGHGITVVGDFVPINQSARLAVAMVCDPESRDVMVSASRVPRTKPHLPSGRLVDAYWMHGGERLRLREVLAHDGKSVRRGILGGI